LRSGECTFACDPDAQREPRLGRVRLCHVSVTYFRRRHSLLRP
jgi:hypothetical protein